MPTLPLLHHRCHHRPNPLPSSLNTTHRSILHRCSSSPSNIDWGFDTSIRDDCSFDWGFDPRLGFGWRWLQLRLGLRPEIGSSTRDGSSSDYGFDWSFNPRLGLQLEMAVAPTGASILRLGLRLRGVAAIINYKRAVSLCRHSIFTHLQRSVSL